MIQMRRLDEQVTVSGQIGPEDVAALAAAGFRTLINNRPDGEQPGQPAGSDIEAAAAAAGLAYHHIPVAGGFAPARIEAMMAALREVPAFAFCASGTRSTYLWALARAGDGEPAETLVGKAAAAGYDLRPLLPHLTR